MITGIIYAQGDAPGSATVIYTVTAGTLGFVTSMMIVNTDSASHAFTFYTRPNGGTEQPWGGVNVSIAAGAAHELMDVVNRLRLPGAAEILFEADDTSVKYTLSGVEVDG